MSLSVGSSSSKWSISLVLPRHRVCLHFLRFPFPESVGASLSPVSCLCRRGLSYKSAVEEELEGKFLSGGKKQVVCLVSLFYVCDVAVEQQLPMVYQGNVGAYFLYCRHIVGRQHYSGSSVVQTPDELLEKGAVDGVETAERFVKYHQLRFVYECRDDLHLLLVSFDSSFYASASVRGLG